MQTEVNYKQLGITIKKVCQSVGLTQDKLVEIVDCNTSIDYLLSNAMPNSSLLFI